MRRGCRGGEDSTLSLHTEGRSAYAHSTTNKEGTETSSGLTERPIPLLTAQELLQLTDEQIIGFHRRLPPFRAQRMDWRHEPLLRQRYGIHPPKLPLLPPVAEIPIVQPHTAVSEAYMSPDR